MKTIDKRYKAHWHYADLTGCSTLIGRDIQGNQQIPMTLDHSKTYTNNNDIKLLSVQVGGGIAKSVIMFKNIISLLTIPLTTYALVFGKTRTRPPDHLSNQSHKSLFLSPPSFRTNLSILPGKWSRFCETQPGELPLIRSVNKISCTTCLKKTCT